MSDQEKRIQEVLAGSAEKSVTAETLDAFYHHLLEMLSMPCDVVGKADLVRYVLVDIEDSGDDMYGLLGKLQLASDEKQEHVIPLCDIKAVDNRSLEFVMLNDYSTWFVNSQF